MDAMGISPISPAITNDFNKLPVELREGEVNSNNRKNLHVS